MVMYRMLLLFQGLGINQVLCVWLGMMSLGMPSVNVEEGGVVDTSRAIVERVFTAVYFISVRDDGDMTLHIIEQTQLQAISH